MSALTGTRRLTPSKPYPPATCHLLPTLNQRGPCLYRPLPTPYLTLVSRIGISGPRVGGYLPGRCSRRPTRRRHATRIRGPQRRTATSKTYRCRRPTETPTELRTEIRMEREIPMASSTQYTNIGTEYGTVFYHLYNPTYPVPTVACRPWPQRQPTDGTIYS